MKKRINKIRIFLGGLAILLVMLSSMAVVAETIVIRAVDDAEEWNGIFRDQPYSSSGGPVFWLVYGHDAQMMGYRFENVNIPAGATITDAEFSINVRNRDYLGGSLLKIDGELSVSPEPFSTVGTDLSSRPTTASGNDVTWNPTGSTSPNIAEIVKEIVNQPLWATSKTILLMTEKIYSQSSYSTLLAYSADHPYSWRRPTLRITYDPTPQATIEPDTISLGPTCFEGYDAASTSFVLTETGGSVDFIGTVSTSNTWISITNGEFNASNPLGMGTSATVSVDYDTSGLSAGTHTGTITISGNATNSPRTINVTLLVKAVPASAACGEIPLYAENLINPAIMVQLDTSGSMSTMMPILADGKNPRTPSLVSIVQEIVNRETVNTPADPDYAAGWQAGNDMGFIITGSGKRRAYSYDGQTVGAPKLSVTFSMPGGPSIDVEYRISSSEDDVQDRYSSIRTYEDYLELGRSGDPVGLIFQDVDIPQGATIESAEIQFVISSGDSITTSLTIYGVDLDSAPAFIELDQLSNDYTSSAVAWNVQSWASTQSRIDIAEDVLKEVFLDRSISWGFATWAGGNCSSWDSDNATNYYTNYRIGVHTHDATHQEQLQLKADDGYASGCTPLAPTMKAAYNYFTELRKDSYYNEYFVDYDCQPRIAVLVTDGIGNTATTMALVEARANELLAEGISVVAIGFGIDESQAGQLYKIAELAQTAGKLDDNDFVYPLHKEDSSGTGVPYLAQSREDFINAMTSIVSSVKAQAFHGSAPAATTSADNGEVLLSSTFNASNWTGDVSATKFDYYTGALENTTLWTASGSMPGTINGYIYDSTATSLVSPYADASLSTDNFLCKPIGDIINSTPKIVGKPAYWYRFDNYSSFKYNPEVFNRDALAYVAANDGALHALDLNTGVEKWRFYPNAVKAKLNLMGVDPSKDMCSASYCHQFIFDGSPQAADIYTGSSWKTIVVTGLGEGGSAYIGLDVTYGNDFTPTASGDEGDTPSRFLWEFTDSELGLATAFPEIERVVKVDASDQAIGSTWVSLFGSGAMESYLDQQSKEAYLYGINSWNASSVWLDSSSVSISKVKLAPGLLEDDWAGPPIAVDLSDSGLNNRVYITNMYGNMYRVSNIGDGQHPNVDTFFYSGKTDHSSPALAKPAFAYYQDPDHDSVYDIWVYFGTGKYIDQIDKVSTDPQYFYGLQDIEGSSENTSNTEDAAYIPADLEEFNTSIVTAYAVDADGNDVDLDGNGSVGPEDLEKYRTLSCTNPVGGECNPNNLSWRLALATGGGPSERSINQPLVVAGIVFFVTFVPDGDPCEGNGDAWLFAVDYETGGFVSEAVFDINNDGVYDDADKTVRDPNSGGLVGVGGIYLGEGKPTDPVIHGDIIFAGTSGMPPKPIKVNLPDAQARLKAWRQLFN